MAYLVLARKYRPATFAEIVGQEHVTRALSNAIKLDRVAHAFLFTGARGVGKTTAARVLAKALQCENGPAAEPCNTCRACTEITSGSAVDVFEIDGASNRGINEIRELRDGVAYAPARDRFKIYIIDEVHMLTSEAFNALLKTLEEPPRHVKFVFATTEPQKIPVTILSRCQRYDFKRVPLGQVKTHLDKVLASEGIDVADEGVRMVARESEGSVRDALSLMDRVISFAGSEATAETVAECLGVADRKWLIDFVRGVLGGDTGAALQVVEDVHHYGFDIRAFTTDLLNTVRDLIVVKLCGTDARVAQLSDAEARVLNEIAGPHSIGALQAMFRVLLESGDEIAASRHPRLVLEMAAVRCASLRDLQAVPEVLARLEALESRLSSGAPAPQPSAPRQSAPQAAPQRPQAPAPSRPAPSRPAAISESPRGSATVLDAPSGQPLDPKTWPDTVASIKKRDPLLASMLENTVVMGPATLGVANDFFRTKLAEGRDHQRLLDLLGLRSLEVRAADAEAPTIASARNARHAEEILERKARLENHPLTQATQQTLGARIEAVRPSEEFDSDE